MSGRSASAALLVVAMALLLPATAVARYDPIAGGATRLNLSDGFLSSLERKGVELSAIFPARLKGAVLTLPVSGGRFDPLSGKGTVEHDGALVFEAGARTISVSRLTLKTTRRSAPFSAKVGGSQLKIGATGGLSVSRAGFGVKARVGELSLSAKVATRLGKKLRLPDVFAPGQALGGAVTRAEPETVTLLGTGALTLALDPAFVAKLRDRFVAVNPIFPAERPGSVFTLPIFGGDLAPAGARGTIETRGALEFIQLGGGQVFWSEALLDLGTRTASPEVETRPSPPYAGRVGAIPVAALGFATWVVADPRARSFAGETITLLLAPTTAQTFNEVFANPPGSDAVFAPGEALGTVAFVAQGQ